MEVNRLGLLAVKGPRPLLKLPKLPVEENVAALVPLNLAFEDILLGSAPVALRFMTLRC